jgi:type I restriction enzyme M protein
VSLVDPDINDKICDPACGTAGFLVNAYEHIVKKYTSEQFLREEEDGETHGLIGDKITNPEAWQKLREDTFFGYDFDTTMVKIGLMNMLTAWY